VSQRISDAEYARFAKVRAWLDPPHPGTPDDRLADFPPAFQVCGIITNGQPVGEPDAVFFQEAVSITANYLDPTTGCYPSRAAHVNPDQPAPVLDRHHLHGAAAGTPR